MRVPEDDSRVQQCICSYAKTLKTYLGPEIALADNITRSPLYALGEKGGAPKIDRTDENLFIKSYWSDLLPHLKWTLACKGPMFRYRVVTDEKIKTVYLGNESYRGRAKDVRDDVVTYNSIGDLVGPDLDLVILRLGFLGYKNVAMPGILKEALMVRESAMKPTWIVEVPSSLFGYGHFSYNEDVGSYIERTFQVVNLVRERSEVDAPHGFAGAEEPDEEVGLGPQTPDHMPQQRIQPTPRFQAPPEPEMPTAIWSESSYKSKPKFGKKRSGGGPV
jgi:hypothetical protein